MAKNFDAKIRLGAIDNVSQTIERVRSKFPKLDKAVTRTNFLFENLQRNTKDFRGALANIGSTLTGVGKNMTAFATLPIAGALFVAVKSASDFETALLGVGKTTNLSGRALEQMGEKFQDLSTRIPLSSSELLQLGQTAAQLGVRGTDNILKFSETMAKLATASNVAGEEGASAMARLISVTGGAIGDVDRFAATLVDLGNNSRTTEKDILAFATRLGSSTTIFGTTGVQALGLGAALASVGIEAEAGSSAVQRALGAINKAILKGGAGLNALSQLTGVATGDLKERFKKDAIGVLTEFSQGVSNIGKKGGDISKVLGSFGLSGVRDIAVLGTMAQKIDEVKASLGRSSQAFKDNTALNQEFSAQVDSAKNVWQLFQNNLDVFTQSVGKELLPILKALSKDFLVPILQWAAAFAKAHPGIVKIALAIAVTIAVMGPLLIIIGSMILGLVKLIAAWNFLTAVITSLVTVFSSLLGVFAAVISFPALIIAGIVAIVAAIVIFRNEIVDGLVSAWNLVIEKIDYVVNKLSSVKGFLNSFFGGDVNINANALAPAAAPLGGLESATKANSEFFTQTNNARVDVMVRAPENTRIKSESQNGVLSIQRGLVGAF